MSQRFPNPQKVYSYQVLNLSFPGKISASIFLSSTTEHAWAKEFAPPTPWKLNVLQKIKIFRFKILVFRLKLQANNNNHVIKSGWKVLIMGKVHSNTVQMKNLKGLSPSLSHSTFSPPPCASAETQWRKSWKKQGKEFSLQNASKTVTTFNYNKILISCTKHILVCFPTGSSWQ